MAPVSAVLTDIEGTTSSIAFVKETLFPFAREALEGFLADHGQEPEVAACLTEARRLAKPGEDAAAALRRWMAEDAKVTPLKTLQGLIWRQGYLDGRIEGHLWPDVAPCLRAWARAGIGLHVYSSGSVAAQKLIFGHSAAGDLASLFTGFFDTTTGGKREAASYGAIARNLHLPPESILFLSDVAEELDAAATAGFQTCQLVREADGTQPCDRHRQAVDFPGVAGLFGLPLPRAAAA
ncbi:acireductone synthase [Pseudoroseomonas ludipueritiae]|uniref:Enolase-phosphatase E1 n=1 Tax=Pseudoroseomonas ludipueritiae TaxID=198093 RepID=A0ABR7RDB8_9PROT|nr:acireductone synthase [Pseudoroseomonas ludipueritiae]MBC9179845.1 acireductone synthase [Pseudoroseomonas ludipueritiae]